MFRIILWALTLPFLSLLHFSANAATIYIPEKWIDGKVAIMVDGPIEEGDAEKFLALSTLVETDKIVVLYSTGGQLIPAIKIGERIREAGYETVVPDGAKCTSACALIWIAGKKRWLSEKGTIGFHAAYRDKQGKLQESGAANAIIGRYLTLLGFPAKSVIFATREPPHSLMELSKLNSDAAGISFETLPPSWSAANIARKEAALPPPPIVIAPAKPAEKKREANFQLDWMWGSEDRAGVFELTDEETRLVYEVKAPWWASRQYLAALLSDHLKNSRWLYVTGSDLGSQIFIDLESLNVSSGRVTTWVKWDHRKDKSTRDRERLVYQIYYCKSDSYSTLEEVTYDPAGRVTSSEKWSGASPRKVVPDTIGEALLEMLCWKKG
ncbi:surface-adhesin E family protein [Altererythrobacter sp. Z27]|uniref:surface-adhesin E family protein n=1 Tax=Altererythrobacter sp. Z27 TaxID=3461147 RepID=UPI004044789B